MIGGVKVSGPTLISWMDFDNMGSSNSKPAAKLCPNTPNNYIVVLFEILKV